MHLFARTDLGVRPETSSYCDVTFYCYGRTRLHSAMAKWILRSNHKTLSMEYLLIWNEFFELPNKQHYLNCHIDDCRKSVCILVKRLHFQSKPFGDQDLLTTILRTWEEHEKTSLLSTTYGQR